MSQRLILQTPLGTGRAGAIVVDAVLDNLRHHQVARVTCARSLLHA